MNKFGKNCKECGCNAFGKNCNGCGYNRFGSNCKKVNGFGSNCKNINGFGAKASSIKGYSSLTKKHLSDFHVINGIDVDMSSTKDKLFSNLKKVYGNITPAEIKQSVATGDTLANIRAIAQRQKDAELEAKRVAAALKAKEQKDKIKKITYSPREPQILKEVVARRMPAGSKVKRLTRPAVSSSDMDDLADMFSSARASSDNMSSLMGGLRLSFGG